MTRATSTRGSRGFAVRLRPRRRRPRRDRQRGVALIAVTVALTMTGLLVNEFRTDAQVDEFASDNARDQMRAEMLARSSINLAEMLLRLQQVLDNKDVQDALQLGPIQITEYADLFMQAFGGTAEEVAASTGLAGDDARSLGADIGAFGISIDSDDGKINLNCANGKRDYAQLTYTLLDALYYFPAYDPVFQDADADGWRRDRRLQTEAILDFIDEDTSKVSPPGEPTASGPEDYGYEGLTDDYKPKNDYLDSLEEVRLIRGVDERFWTLFSPAFTVYGGCKLNVRAVSDPRILAAIIFLTVDNKDDRVVRDGNLLWLHAQAASWAVQNGMPFDKPEDFVEFMKDPEAAIGGLAGLGGDGTGATGAAAGTTPQITIPGIPPGTDLGVELKQEEVAKILRAGPQRTYRLEAWGEVTRNAPFMPVRRTITAVWDMGTVNVNQRSTEARARNGAWVYFRRN